MGKKNPVKPSVIGNHRFAPTVETGKLFKIGTVPKPLGVAVFIPPRINWFGCVALSSVVPAFKIIQFG